MIRIIIRQMNAKIIFAVLVVVGASVPPVVTAAQKRGPVLPKEIALPRPMQIASCTPKVTPSPEP